MGCERPAAPFLAKEVCFITIEDETGIANLVVWSKVMTAYRKVIMRARVIDVRGVVQRSDDVIHIVAHHLVDRSDALERLSHPDRLAAQEDHPKSVQPQASHTHPRDLRVIPKSRDFH